MNAIETRNRLSELTEQAIIKNDIESLKLIEKALQNPPELAPANYAEFFYSMVPEEMLEQIDFLR
jgi:hypothetical protein